MQIGDRYRLDEQIGQGGTGEVWRAIDQSSNRVVAVKLLHPWVAEDASARERFRREAAAMERLHHPHIVQVLDFNDTAPRPYLVQEHCPGGTLAPLAAAGRVPWDRIRALARPIASALAHAHANGVIHRDLKPSNVLFAEGGRVVVGDFGLARLLAGSDGTLTATGMRMGSPEYWSPEQAAGKPVSEKSDVYGLGCVLYQLLTGALPFTGEDRLAAGYRRVHEDPPRLDGPGSSLITAMMTRAAAARPRAEDVLAELEGRAIDATRVMRPESDQPTERLLPPTIAAEPVRARETIVIPPPPAPAAVTRPPASYPGIRLGGAVLALLLGASAIGVGAVAGQSTRVIDVDRSGLVLRGERAADDAIAGLVLLGSAVAVTVALAIAAVWAARQSGRARLAFVRGTLGIAAIVVSCVAAAALVWTAHAGATAGIEQLLTDAGL